MSGAPAAIQQPRKSFAQVAAAANRPIIQKEKPVNPPVNQDKTKDLDQRHVQTSVPRVALPAKILNNHSIGRTSAVISSKIKDSDVEKTITALQVTTIDEASTSGSLSNDAHSRKDNSDTKSVTSRTTLTLDEKESLRPDDSASMQAAVEEDAFSPVGSVFTHSKPESNPEARAFREQLNQIGLNGNDRVIMPRAQRPERIGEHETRGIVLLSAPVETMRVSPESVEPEQPRAALPTTWIVPPDPKLCEALESPKDRLFVLKVEQDLIDFVKDPKEEFLQLPGTNSFYRMLSHKLADYYMLGHVVDDTMSSVRIYRTPNTRLPPPLINSTPRTNDSTPPPAAGARKIMRRGGASKSSMNNGTVDGSFDSLTSSKATSDVGSDDKKDGKATEWAALTREERESRYNETRARIFKDFKEKEVIEAVNGDKELSRSSSASDTKKNKKQRKPKDDAFEARSAFDAFGRRISTNALPNSSDAPPFEQFFPDGQGQFVSNGQPFAMENGFQMAYSSPEDAAAATNGGMSLQWHQQNMSGHGFPGAQYALSSPTFSQDGYNVYGATYDANQLSPNMAMERTPKGTAPSLAGFRPGYIQANPMVWSQEGYMNAYPDASFPYQDYNGNYTMFYPNQMIPQTIPANGFNAFSAQQQATMNYNQAYVPTNIEPASFDPRSRSFVPSVRGAQGSQRGGNSQFYPQTNPNGYAAVSNKQSNSNGVRSNGTFPSSQPVSQQAQTNGNGSNNHFRRQSGNARNRQQNQHHQQAQAGANANAGARPHQGRGVSSISKWAAPANLPAKPPAPTGSNSSAQQLPPKPVATR